MKRWETTFSVEVKDILAAKLGVELFELKGDALFTDNLGADSLDVMKTFTEIERKFNIKIDVGNAKKLKTVDQIIYIKQRILE